MLFSSYYTIYTIVLHASFCLSRNNNDNKNNNNNNNIVVVVVVRKSMRSLKLLWTTSLVKQFLTIK